MPCRSIIALMLAATSAFGASTKIRDLANIEGVRDNQLLGYGLVVGLNGTGDKRQTVFSAQTLTNLLSRMGVTVQPAAILVRNTAAVLITATLPPFGQPGSRIDVTVATVGDASNLQGGLLVMTPLKGPDNRVYAVAQGSVVTGGFVAGGRSTGQTVNHPTAGRVPNGAIIERVAPSVEPGDQVHLQLRNPNYTAAARIAHAIDNHFAGTQVSVAHADNSALIVVDIPEKFRHRGVEFIAALEDLTIESDNPARVVINERTGTVVMGREVTISPVTILHGALTVEIATTDTVSQPPPLSGGETTVTPQTRVAANQGPVKNVSLKPGATVDELVRALVATGSTPRDIIAVLQALKAAGAMDAELEVI
ncbi:MAG TPA: flagellar basal body P-ring protein FlgI [Bryobacteraceae bacterium]|nr:flagellar basal body P-ring protein FlgI [Bryobacteraceae bacterium]